MSKPKLNLKEESSAKKTRSPPKKTKVEQSVPKKKKLKTDAEKAAEKAQHLRFGKAELTPDELSRLSKAQKREMYAAHAARSAVHHEVDQYEDENVGVQALSEGEKAAGNVRDISKSRYARKLKKKAKMQGKKGSKTAKSSASEPTAAQDAGASGTGEGGSNWLSRWKQRQEIHKSYYAAARSGTAAQTAGGKAASNGASTARSGVEQAVEKGKTAVSTAVKGLVNAAKGNAHVLVIVGVFLLLILMVMSGFSSCGILFSGGTQVSGQTMYSAEDRDIRGAEQDYKKLEKELDKKIKRTPTDHPGYNEYQYHLDPIEHDPWQLTSFLTTLYDDYTRSEVQGKLKETFKKQYKFTTWVEVQIRYKTVWVISPAGIPVPTQVPYEYRIFHTKLVNRGLEVVIREELNNDQWKRYEIFQDRSYCTIMNRSQAFFLRRVRVSSSVRWMPDMNRFRSLPEAQSLPQTKHSLRTARTRRSIQQRRRCWNSSQALPSRAACSARCTAARFRLWRKSAGMPAAWRFWKMS